ncbi:TetR/AcrR family transcriptional regulator [Labilibaculum euxinus]|uniref:TetR family transcriptional regulator n=1 Tax=Labilibaculum euxinus TaxID=2686357 RepID=A0A7M4D5L8_9BACT|nr:TetR/AcrR family transcriptional regulator [Labilibaculum euxinus]MUP37947.1 TetR family transcriptional regulator [Labilibaculum euxinus]MVB07152.1 TetR family transcriptional regulator [Labilibaculum euxinus]
MQIQKENSKESILKVAGEEFFAKGFKDSSMRIIAKKSGVGLSNIYNYFKNKDEIFCEVLASLLSAFNSMIEDHNRPENISLNMFTDADLQRKMIDDFVYLINQYRSELKLLLFYAHGSSLENFREEFTVRNTKTGLEYIRKMKEKYPQVNTNISDFFTHTISSWWLSIIGEIVTHDDLSDIEIENFISEFIVFVTGGWERLMDV